MGFIEKEELIGLAILLLVIIGLSLAGKLTQEAVEGIKYVGSAFMLSKGMSGLMPGKSD